jgi:hypothetical protein
MALKSSITAFNKASNSDSKVVMLIDLIGNKLLFPKQPSALVIAYSASRVVLFYLF